MAIFCFFTWQREIVRDREACYAAVHGASKELDMTGRLNDNANDSCFITLPPFLLFSNVSQPYGYTKPLPLW